MQLLERGLQDTAFDAGDGKIVSGETMTRLCTILAGIEEALLALEPMHGFIYPMFVFAAHTGARRSEMRRSQIHDIDLD